MIHVRLDVVNLVHMIPQRDRRGMHASRGWESESLDALNAAAFNRLLRKNLHQVARVLWSKESHLAELSIHLFGQYLL